MTAKKRIAALAAVATLAVARVAAPAQLQAGVDTIPFELVGGRPHVQVYVNGRGPYAFALDTGAEGVGRADSILTHAVNLKVAGTADISDGITSRQQAIVKIDSLRLGRLTLRDVTVPSRSYRLKTAGGAPLYGIIGPSFFANHTFTIDYGRSELRISTARLNANDRWTVAYERAFRVPFLIGKHPSVIHIDTGFGDGIHIPLRDTAAAKPSKLQSSGTGATTQNRVRIYRGVVSIPLIVAGNHLEPFEVAFTEMLPGNVLGAKVLKDYVLSIDQRSKLVRMQPIGSQ